VDRSLHDLLGALSSLLMWEEVLRSCVDDRIRRSEALAAIRDSAREMTRIVHDIVDVTRPPVDR
jgi:signal transduction histidine kinase